MTLIVRAVKTCAAAPTQWDAWTDEGQYLYLRFRHGRGRVEAQPGPDPDTWTWPPAPLATFEHTELDGCIRLAEFAELAGLTLAPGLVEENEPGPIYVIEIPSPYVEGCPGCSRGFGAIALVGHRPGCPAGVASR